MRACYKCAMRRQHGASSPMPLRATDNSGNTLRLAVILQLRRAETGVENMSENGRIPAALALESVGLNRVLVRFGEERELVWIEKGSDGRRCSNAYCSQQHERPHYELDSSVKQLNGTKVKRKQKQQRRQECPQDPSVHRSVRSSSARRGWRAETAG